MRKANKCLMFLTLMMVLSLTLAGCGESTSTGGVSISGYVEGLPSGALAGVKVDMGGKAHAISNSSGLFMVSSFPPGSYIMSFSKEGYWTYSFPIQFEKTGSYRFTDDIYLSKTTYYQEFVENPSFIRDINNDSHITIQADNRVNQLIALACNVYTSQSGVESCVQISTDSGTSLSGTMITGKSLSLNQRPNIYQQRLRDFDKRVNQSLLRQGVQPGIPRGLARVKSAEPQLTFYKYNFDQNDTFTTVTANLIYNGTKCVIYLDSLQVIPDTYIQQLGQAFDTYYYDRVIQYFGDLTVDIDAFPKIYILLSELPHDDQGMIIGYFSSINEFLPSQETYSNEKEMFYLTTYTGGATYDSWLNLMKSTSAHEFQHLISYSCRGVDERVETWINEGLSMLAEDIAVAGPGEHNPSLDEWVKLYLKYHTYDSLTDWQDDVLDYASAYMFMRYLADRCGEANIRAINMSSQAYVGNQLLADIAGVSQFDDLFRDWLTAVILDAVGYTTSDPDLSKKYLYQSLNLTAFEFPKESPGYTYMSNGTGAFIDMTNLDAAKRIDVGVAGGNGMIFRLIMLPVSGTSFSLNVHPMTLIK